MKKTECYIKVGQCARIALAKKDKPPKWLEKQTGLSKARVSAILNNDAANTTTISALAWAFRMKVSEFIALGE